MKNSKPARITDRVFITAVIFSFALSLIVALSFAAALGLSWHALLGTFMILQIIVCVAVIVRGENQKDSDDG